MAFYGVNVVASTFLGIVCTIGIIHAFCLTDETYHPIVGASMLVLPCYAVAYFEWIAFREPSRRIERRLGFVYLYISVAFFISLVAGVVKEVQEGIGWSWVSFMLFSVWSMLFGYLAACGYYRVRRSRNSDMMLRK